MSKDRLARILGLFSLLLAALVAATAGTIAQAPAAPAGDVTFTKDIAPILQRSCQHCHHPDSVAPMSLLTYEDARPWARAMKTRTALRTQRGAMPPWFVEKNIGIQSFKDDPSLSEEEIAKIAKWADSGAPRGNPADMPPPLHFDSTDKWTIGEPDLVLRSPDVIVPAVGPDKWGDFGLVPTGLTEDRYVSAVEVREVNDIPKGGATKTVGGRYAFHHMTYSSVVQGERESASRRGKLHQLADSRSRAQRRHLSARGRQAAGGEFGLALSAGHLHSNGRETKAHLEFAFKFFPKGYKPLYRRSSLRSGQRHRHRHEAESSQSGAALVRRRCRSTPRSSRSSRTCTRPACACASRRSGATTSRRSTAWDTITTGSSSTSTKTMRAPLLPKGTIVHLIGFLDTTPANRNPADPRNWAGGGRRSIANMFIDLGYSVSLTEEQFQAEMAKRRQNMKSRNDYDIGCPLCWAPPVLQTQPTTAGTGQAVMRAFGTCAGRERGDCCSLPSRGGSALLFQVAGAQTRFTYSSGQSVSPAYEGWWPNEDGSFTMFFGYMNTNWLEEFDIPVGPDNNIQPGGPDQGQPTHFYPRRNPFLFTIRVPKDFGTKELIWTLTTNGKTERAYASLKGDYQIDKQVISTEVGGDGGSLRDELRSNMPPELKVEGDTRRSVKVGEPVTLIALASDPDNLPARRGGRAQPAEGSRAAGRSARAATSSAEPRVSASLVDYPVQWPRLAVVVDRLSRQGRSGDVQPRADEDVDGHAGVRQLSVVASVPDSGAASGRQVGGAVDLPGAGNLCAPCRCQ